jgi:hypothetical protein
MPGDNLATQLAQASNGINGRGPLAGRMPFMPAATLNQLRGELLLSCDLRRKVLLGWLKLLFFVLF